jgi:hypothetical protein
LVLCPGHRRLAVLNQGGRNATLPYLTQLTQAWTKAGEDQDSPLPFAPSYLGGNRECVAAKI